MTVFYQLWCYYERVDEWVMEGLFRTVEEASKHCDGLRDDMSIDVENPCMPDWAVVEVRGKW